MESRVIYTYIVEYKDCDKFQLDCDSVVMTDKAVIFKGEDALLFAVNLDEVRSITLKGVTNEDDDTNGDD